VDEECCVSHVITPANHRAEDGARPLVESSRVLLCMDIWTLGTVPRREDRKFVLSG
jgi:hypothetical protein